MKRGKFRQGKIPTYSRASVDGSQADRGNAALKLQMKRLLGNQFVRRENSRLAIRGFTISERGTVEEDERGVDERFRKDTQKVHIGKEIYL